MMKGLLAQAQA